MNEYFIVSNSFAAPFFSDQGEGFVKATSPKRALLEYVNTYDHPAGLYSAAVYKDANDYHKGKKAVAKWICNAELEKQRLTKGLGSYSIRGVGPGEVEINGVTHFINNPKGGKIID